MRTASPLAVLAAELGRTSDPISFFDAMLVVREARRQSDLDERSLGIVMGLHDDARATDGARQVLAEFLRGCVQKISRERELAGRPIGLSDSGKVARAAAGSVITLSLEARRGAGWRWEIELVKGPAQCKEIGPKGSTTQFSVELLRPGRGRLVLVEQPPPSVRNTEARRFEIQVVVEKKAWDPL